MNVSRLVSLIAGIAGAGLLLNPAVASPPDLGTTEAHNRAQQQQQSVAIPLPSFAPLAQRVLPAVVNISVELNQQTALPDETNGSGSGVSPPSGGTPFDQFLRRFFQNRLPTPGTNRHVLTLGSGFLIDPHGYIVTNNHAIDNAGKVTVIFQDLSKHAAKIVGRDDTTDLALLKITTNKPLPYVAWGDSDKVKVGDWVVAVGDPFGLGSSVTAGIVSALGRNINEGPYDDFLQIDAPINRGNSGGPTFDLTGRVIGINTAIYSPSGGSVGIGFAIPSDLAKYVVGELEAHGTVTWGWLGVSIQDLTPSVGKGLGLNPDHLEGALVAAVLSNSPAAKAGLQAGDVIVEAGDRPIHSAHDLPRIVAESKVGSQLDLTVERGGKKQTLIAAIGAMPAEQQAAAGTGSTIPSAGPSVALGLELAPLGPELRKELKLGNDIHGVVVTGIAPGAPIAGTGLEPGDVIQSIDQKPVTTPAQAATALASAAKRGDILLLINRHGASVFVGVTVESGGAKQPG